MPKYVVLSTHKERYRISQGKLTMKGMMQLISSKKCITLVLDLVNETNTRQNKNASSQYLDFIWFEISGSYSKAQSLSGSVNILSSCQTPSEGKETSYNTSSCKQYKLNAKIKIEKKYNANRQFYTNQFFLCLRCVYLWLLLEGFGMQQ